MVLYLELLVELSDHLVVKIGTIVRNDPLRYSVSTDQVVPNEPCHDVLGYGSKGSCFNPLGKVINRYQNETMPVGCCDTVGELTMFFAFVFANVSVEQESPPTFYFILRKGQKAQEIPLRCFLGFGE